MSGQVCTYVGNVLERCEFRPVVRLVAFVIADRANRDGIAYPSVDAIARRAGVTPANVRRAVAELVDAGVFAIERGGGRGRTNVYRFPVASAISPTRPLPRGYLSAKPARRTHETRAEDARNPRATARRTEQEQNNEHRAPPWVVNGESFDTWRRGFVDHPDTAAGG